MSNKKNDKGKLFHKLHHLQKMVTRLLKRGKKDKMVEIQEKHLIEKIKVYLGWSSDCPGKEISSPSPFEP